MLGNDPEALFILPFGCAATVHIMEAANKQQLHRLQDGVGIALCPAYADPLNGVMGEWTSVKVLFPLEHSHGVY